MRSAARKMRSRAAWPTRLPLAGADCPRALPGFDATARVRSEAVGFVRLLTTSRI